MPTITTDIHIINAALAGLSINPIDSLSDNTEQAKLADVTYVQHLEALLSEHPWNFAMTHTTLGMAIPPTAAWRWDYAFTLPTPGSDLLRIWEVEGQGADEEEEWTVSDRLLLTNLTENKQITFDTPAGAVITSVAHGLENGDVVIVIDGGDGLPAALAEDTLHYVVEKTADTLKLSLTLGGSAITTASDGGDDNFILRRTVDIRYVQYIADETLYSPQFLSALIAKLESEWAEALVKATTLGDRKDAKYMEKVATARSIDGQEGTSERQDTSTWTDSR